MKQKQRFRKVQKIGEILPRALTQGRALTHGNLARKIEACSALPYWEDIVGEQLAEISTPERIISGRILVVRVADATWAQELAMQKEDILERLHARGEGAAFEDIHFHPGDPRQFK